MHAIVHSRATRQAPETCSQHTYAQDVLQEMMRRQPRAPRTMLKAATTRVCNVLARVAALMGQERNMHPRSRSLRALCLTHADLTRIVLAVGSLIEGQEVRVRGVGWGGEGGNGERGAMDVQEAGGWRGEEEERGACARIGRAFAAVDGMLVEFITERVLVQAQLYFDLMRYTD